MIAWGVARGVVLKGCGSLLQMSAVPELTETLMAGAFTVYTSGFTSVLALLMFFD